MMSGHSVYDDGVLRITRHDSPPVVALAGEIDEATYAGLVGALAEAVDGQSEVHFDLAGVEYCDLAGLRAIVCVTGADRHGNGIRRRVVLHQLPPELETVLRIVGWDSTPGLSMEGPRGGGPVRPDPVIGAGAQAEGSA
jgi:ABC-type transporter Mla MlaB component